MYVLFSIVWAFMVVTLAQAGFEVPRWRSHGEENLPFPYPMTEVLAYVAAAAIEVTVLVALVKPWQLHRLWRRLVFALCLFVPWMLLSGAPYMHLPPVHARHFAWVSSMVLASLAGLATLSFMGLVTLIVRLIWPAQEPSG